MLEAWARLHKQMKWRLIVLQSQFVTELTHAVRMRSAWLMYEQLDKSI